ncbi:MAG: hypothetical protein MUF01_12490 [Bryobacterales bacterium]|nr:hypothetical protein [Bryobacterales bacterium]
MRVISRISFLCLAGGWMGWTVYHFQKIDGSAVQWIKAQEGTFLLYTVLFGALIGFLLGQLGRSSVSVAHRNAGGVGLVLVGGTVLHWGMPALVAQNDAIRISALLIFGATGGGAFTFGLQRGAFTRFLPFILLLLPFLVLPVIAGLPLMGPALLAGLIAALSFGRYLQQKLAPACAADLVGEEACLTLRLALGILSLSILGFVLGVAHLAHNPAILVVLGLLLFLTRRTLQEEAAAWNQWLTRPVQPVHAVGGFTLAGLIWAVLLIGWTAALAPETGPDALGGRMAIVRMWVNDGALEHYREMNLSCMAIAGETFFLMLHPLAGVQAAKLGQFLAALALIPLFAHLIPHRTLAAGLLTIALGVSSLFLVQFAWGFVDLVQTLFYCSSLLAGWIWWQKRNRGTLVLAAALAAGAAAVKLNGLGALLILGTIVLFARLRTWSPRALVLDAMAIGLAAIIILAPWLARSYFLSGNPIFPYANAFFGSPLAPSGLIAKRFGDPHGLRELFHLPWNVFFHPGRYAEIGTYHPLLLMVIPMLLPAMFVARARFWILTGMAAGLLWWLTEQNLRYSIFAVIPIVGGLAYSLDSILSTTHPRGRKIVSIFAIFFSLGGTYLQFVRPTAWLFRSQDAAAMPLSVVLGKTARNDYLAVQLAHTPLLRHLDKIAGAKAVVWEVPFLRDHLHLAGRAIAMPHCDARLSEQLRPLLDLPPSPENFRHIVESLQTLGITHLLLTPESPWAPRQPGGPRSAIFSEEFRKTVARVEYANRGYELLSLPIKEDRLPPTHRGNNLLTNPNFAMEKDHSHPTGWAPSGVFPSDSGSAPVLPPDFTLYQGVSVEPERLYWMEVIFSPQKPAQGAYLHGAWRDQDGQLVAYHNYPLTALHMAGRAGFYQTAPEGATHLDLTLRGPIAPRSILLQPVYRAPNLSP